MNGRELEHVLSLIDANIGTTQNRVRQEILRFITEHQDRVLEELRQTQHASIPTSSGCVEISLADLREAVA